MALAKTLFDQGYSIQGRRHIGLVSAFIRLTNKILSLEVVFKSSSKRLSGLYLVVVHEFHFI